MTPLEYQLWCRRFDNHDHEGRLALALGLCSEAGEVAAQFEKFCRRGIPRKIDRDAVALELGDVMWNVARLADELGYTLEDLMTMNVNKLVKRYEERGLELQ